MKPGILAIDIGGTAVKATVVDDDGRMLAERIRTPTPPSCGPREMVELIVAMVGPLPPFDRISIGFPGVIRDGHVLTAANLDTPRWRGFALADVLSQRLHGRPAKIVNDADMQGYALISGVGLEFVVTLGTGMGTALFRDGELMPHMELAHHPVHNGKTYDEYLGSHALEHIGKAKWNKRLHRALELFEILFHPDRIYIGGGDATHVTLALPDNIIIGSNDAGMEGGAALWRPASEPLLRPLPAHAGPLG